MFRTIVNAFKDADIRKRILITLGFVLMYRIGCFVPIPGLDIGQMMNKAITDDFFMLLSAITGSAFSNGTIFALGIVPFINSYIIMELLSILMA